MNNVRPILPRHYRIHSDQLLLLSRHRHHYPQISIKAVGKIPPQDQIGSSILLLSFLNRPWPSHRALVSPRLLDVPFCTRQRDDSHTGNVALEQSSTVEGDLGQLWTWMLNSRCRLPFYEEA